MSKHPDQSDAQVTPTQEPEVVVVPFSQIVSKPLVHLWQDRLIRGKVSIFAGVHESGKSTLLCDLIARCSVGGVAPDNSALPLLRTMLLASEDNPHDTIKERLEVHAADLDQVLFFEGIRTHTSSVMTIIPLVDLEPHLVEIERSIRENGIDIVAVDPWTAHIGRRSSKHDAEMRAQLMMLVDLAERTDVAIVLVVHTKAGGSAQKALDRLLVATSVGQAARLVWMILDVPPSSAHDAATLGRRRILAVAKSNLTPKPPALEWSRPKDAPVQWYGESRYDIDELSARPTSFTMTPERQDVIDLIQDRGRPIDAADVKFHLHKTSEAARKLLWSMELAKQLVRVAKGRYDDPNRVTGLPQTEEIDAVIATEIITTADSGNARNVDVDTVSSPESVIEDI